MTLRYRKKGKRLKYFLFFSSPLALSRVVPSIAVLNPRKALHEEARLLLEGPALSWSPRRVEVEAFVLSDNYIEGHVFDITQYTIERLCPPRSVRTRIKCPAVRVDCCVHEPKPAQLGHAASAQKMVMTSAKKCRPTFFPPSHSLSDRHRVPFSIGCTHIRTHSFIRALSVVPCLPTDLAVLHTPTIILRIGKELRNSSLQFPSAPNCCCHRLFCIFPLAPITLLYRFLRMNAVACCTVLPVRRYADTARSLCPLSLLPNSLSLYLLSAPPPRPADLLPRTPSQSRSQQFRTFNQRKCLWRNKSSRRSSQSTLLAHNTMLWQQQQTLK